MIEGGEVTPSGNFALYYMQQMELVVKEVAGIRELSLNEIEAECGGWVTCDRYADQSSTMCVLPLQDLQPVSGQVCNSFCN